MCLSNEIINGAPISELYLAVNGLCVNVESGIGKKEGQGRWKPSGCLYPILLRRKIVNLSLGLRKRTVSRKINGGVSVFSQI